MKINELQAKQGNVDIEVEVVSIEEPREFQKFGTTGKVANAMVKDDTGEIKVTLWNDQIDQVKVGDKIKITKGYVSEWKGEKQLSTGKFGQLEVLGSESVEGSESKKGAEKEVKDLPDEDISEEDVV